MSFVFNDITYNILTGSTVAVGSNPTVSGAITIPNQVTNNSTTYTVVAVANNAFKYNYNITSIDLSECSSLTTIGNYAFASANKLTSVKFSSSITSIGNEVFSYSALRSIDISICTNLATIGSYAFSSTGILLIKFPSNITSINSNAFANCSSLQIIEFTGILLPTINANSFSYIKSGAVAYMSSDAFNNSANSASKSVLTSNNPPITISIPGPTFVDNNIIYRILTGSTVAVATSPSASGSITIPNTVVNNSTTYTIVSIETLAFYGNSNIISINLSGCSSLTTIGDSIFNSSNIQTVIFPSSITSIGNYVFAYSKIQSVTFPSNITSIGNNTFYYCSNLISIDLSVCPNLTTLDISVFAYSSIQTVKFPSNITNIGNFTFYYCSNLTSIDLSVYPNLTTLGNSVFAYSSIQTVKFPSNITSIGNQTFYYCQNLTSIDLSVCPNLTTLDINVFAYSSIQSVIFPSNITNIGDFTFYRCSKLKNITFTGTTLPNIGLCFSEIISTGVIAYMSLDAFKNPANSTSKTAMTSNSPPIILKVLQSQMVYFKEDSKILTIHGYKPIQDLRKGDLIKTKNNDFKPIELIGKQSRYHPALLNERINHQLYRCSHTNFPEVFDDLIITGCHSILVDELTEDQIIESTKVNGKVYITEGKYRLPACVDERTSVFEHQGMYTIYHLALENEDPTMNYGIYANGLLVESCSIRFMNPFGKLNEKRK